MNDINVRSDAVDVEQIMRQIRARIREKRGADYTEAEVRELANVKLEKFLDPRVVRSDLVEQFRRHQAVAAAPPPAVTVKIGETHRPLLRAIRRLLNPILKLFFNPDDLVRALQYTADSANDALRATHDRLQRREEMDALYYELIHNLVVEVTRHGIEVHNLSMRVESLASRMDFDERRARSLEGVVQYRPNAQQRPAPPPASEPGEAGAAPAPAAEGGDRAAADGQPRRRRRRRRRRRPGQTLADERAGGAGSHDALDQAGGHDEQADEAGAGTDGGDGDEHDAADGGGDAG